MAASNNSVFVSTNEEATIVSSMKKYKNNIIIHLLTCVSTCQVVCCHGDYFVFPLRHLYFSYILLQPCYAMLLMRQEAKKKKTTTNHLMETLWRNWINIEAEKRLLLARRRIFKNVYFSDLFVVKSASNICLCFHIICYFTVHCSPDPTTQQTATSLNIISNNRISPASSHTDNILVFTCIYILIMYNVHKYINGRITQILISVIVSI